MSLTQLNGEPQYKVWHIRISIEKFVLTLPIIKNGYYWTCAINYLCNVIGLIDWVRLKVRQLFIWWKPTKSCAIIWATLYKISQLIQLNNWFNQRRSAPFLQLQPLVNLHFTLHLISYDILEIRNFSPLKIGLFAIYWIFLVFIMCTFKT